MTQGFEDARPVRFARHAGMEHGYSVQPLKEPHAAECVAECTKRERQILGHLLAAQDHHGRLVMLSRASLRASDQSMTNLFYAGLVNGCGSSDHRGTGNTAGSSWWWLTEKGEQIARIAGLLPKQAA